MDNTRLNGQFPKLTAMRQAPASTAALLRKLVHDPTSGRSSSGGNKSINLNRFMLDRISSNTTQDIIDADATMQLLPDLELAEQILVGSILSPKDMGTADLTIKVAQNQFDSELAGALLDVPIQHFKHDYKIDERLDIQLEEMLTTKGAYIIAVLPENNLDQIINGQHQLSMEDYTKVTKRLAENRPLGFLGHPTQTNVSLETYSSQIEQYSALQDSKGKSVSGVTITDNFNVLKKPEHLAKTRSMRIAERLGGLDSKVSMESIGLSLTTAQIDALYKNRASQSKAVEVIAPQEYMTRPSLGHPLALNLPVESVIPVFVPGKPDEHVGYMVLLDLFGRPVSKASNRDYYNEMRTGFEKTKQKDNSSDLLRLTREAMGGSDSGSTFEMEQIQKTYATILENDLQNRLRNGLYQEELSIGFTEELLRIMTYRKFKEQNTQILYIPAELVTYNAFSYNADGVGQTLLGKSKILSNMRSVLLFAETMGQVRNAVGRKKVSLTLDPDDPDKTDTVAKIQELVLESGRNGFPIGAPDPSQSLDYLTRAGYDFSINADSEDYAQTKVDYDDYTTNVQAGNPDLQDRLRRMHVSSWGVPPEKVDPSASPDFAVGVVNNDLVMSRRVKRYQRTFCQGQTKFIRNYTRNSSILREKLLAIVTERKESLSDEHQKLPAMDVVLLFIDALEASLPEPDTTRIDLMSQAYQQYQDLLSQALDAYITPDMFPDEAFEGASGAADRFKNLVMAYFKRQYLATNNILPELGVLMEINDDKPAFSLLDSQNLTQETLGTAFHEFLQQEQKLKDQWKEKFPPTEPTDSYGGGGSDDFGADTPAEDGGLNDDFGADDFGAPAPDVEEEDPENDPLTEEEEQSVEEDALNPPLEDDSEEEPENQP